MKQSIFMGFSVLVVFAVSSCNTFIGVGRDFQRLGTGIQNTGHGKTWDGQEKPTDPAAPVVPASKR
ncbi:MAG: hypothetical protein KJO21_11370 [Verrucomicrobiae bacterium]|nr:hypothetical protein [Verrucomicrobiae bacterium]NNJ42887.1 hypothetical protein [Akkermansiaceae bacterium]